MIEVEPLPASEHRAKPIQELRHGRKAKLEMRQRDFRRLSREHEQRRRQRRGILLPDPPLAARRERSRPEPEEPIALAGQALRKPFGGSLDPPVLLEPARQLLGCLRRLQIVELGLAGEQAARLQLEQRRDEHEELSARVEVELLPLGEPLDKGEHDSRDVDLDERQLLLQDERQQQVEWTLERVEVEVELTDAHWLRT